MAIGNVKKAREELDQRTRQRHNNVVSKSPYAERVQGSHGSVTIYAGNHFSERQLGGKKKTKKNVVSARFGRQGRRVSVGRLERLDVSGNVLSIKMSREQF